MPSKNVPPTAQTKIIVLCCFPCLHFPCQPSSYVTLLNTPYPCLPYLNSTFSCHLDCCRSPLYGLLALSWSYSTLYFPYSYQTRMILLRLVQFVNSLFITSIDTCVCVLARVCACACSCLFLLSFLSQNKILSGIDRRLRSSSAVY